jgi:hypothetical protein
MYEQDKTNKAKMIGWAIGIVFVAGALLWKVVTH